MVLSEKVWVRMRTKESGSGQLTVAVPVEDLRSKVLGCTTERVGHLRILHVELAQTEIAKCDMAGVVEQDVLRLQITATIISFMSKAQGQKATHRYTTSNSCRCSSANNSSAL